MAVKKTRRDQDKDFGKSLQCFKNQPNINMVIPWIYEMYSSMAKSRDGGEEQQEEDKVEKDLQCFLNQPNINMVIPWVYGIYKSMKSGGSGGGGEGSGDEGLIWKEEG